MKKIIMIISLVALVGIGYFVFYINSDRVNPDSPEGKTIYYTAINNDDVEINNDNRYEYTLKCYDEKGNEKSLNFTTSKELKESSYIKLYDAPLRGVTYWEEIGEEEFPAKVKDIYIK